MAEKVIKNTPYFHIDDENKKTSLVQENITFVESGKKVKEFQETKVLIEDIWTDLKKSSGEWKSNGKKYFYWEYEVTSLEDETIKVQIEAPVPCREVFADEDGNVSFEISDSDSAWSKYWKTEMKKAESNYQDESKITEDRAKVMKTNLVDYTPGNESFPEINTDGVMPKTDDRDLISNLQNILF